MTPEEAAEVWDRHASAYFEAVGRLTVAGSVLERQLTSVLAFWHRREVAVREGVPELSVLVHLKDIGLRSKPPFALLIERVGEGLSRLPDDWASDARRALDEIAELLEHRHDYVHRVMMIRHGETHEVWVSGHSDDGSPFFEPPRLDDMRRVARRLDQLSSHLWILASLPALEMFSGGPPLPYPAEDERED